ncbi:MAG: hypothetical protein FD129_2278, partial [bacterium]
GVVLGVFGPTGELTIALELPCVGRRIYTAVCKKPDGTIITAKCTIECPTTGHVRGDVNGDKTLDISDAITELGCLFLGLACNPCPDVQDYNGDGSADLSDPIGVLADLFQGAQNGSDKPVVCPSAE